MPNLHALRAKADREQDEGRWDSYFGTMWELAEECERCGELDRAKEALLEGLATSKRRKEGARLPSSSRVGWNRWLGDLCTKLECPKEALSFYNKSIELGESADSSQSIEELQMALCNSSLLLSSIALDAWDRGEELESTVLQFKGVKLAQKALARAEELTNLFKGEPIFLEKLLDSLVNLGRAFADAGREAESLRLLQRAQRLMEETGVTGSNKQDVMVNLHSTIANQLGRSSIAVKFAQLDIALSKNRLRYQKRASSELLSPLVAALNSLYEQYICSGNLDEAESVLNNQLMPLCATDGERGEIQGKLGEENPHRRDITSAEWLQDARKNYDKGERLAVRAAKVHRVTLLQEALKSLLQSGDVEVDPLPLKALLAISNRLCEVEEWYEVMDKVEIEQCQVCSKWGISISKSAIRLLTALKIAYGRASPELSLLCDCESEAENPSVLLLSSVKESISADKLQCPLHHHMYVLTAWKQLALASYYRKHPKAASFGMESMLLLLKCIFVQSPTLDAVAPISGAFEDSRVEEYNAWLYKLLAETAKLIGDSFEMIQQDVTAAHCFVLLWKLSLLQQQCFSLDIAGGDQLAMLLLRVERSAMARKVAEGTKSWRIKAWNFPLDLMTPQSSSASVRSYEWVSRVLLFEKEEHEAFVHQILADVQAFVRTIPAVPDMGPILRYYQALPDVVEAVNAESEEGSDSFFEAIVRGNSEEIISPAVHSQQSDGRKRKLSLTDSGTEEANTLISSQSLPSEESQRQVREPPRKIRRTMQQSRSGPPAAMMTVSAGACEAYVVVGRGSGLVVEISSGNSFPLWRTIVEDVKRRGLIKRSSSAALLEWIKDLYLHQTGAAVQFSDGDNAAVQILDRKTVQIAIPLPVATPAGGTSPFDTLSGALNLFQGSLPRQCGARNDVLEGARKFWNAAISVVEGGAIELAIVTREQQRQFQLCSWSFPVALQCLRHFSGRLRLISLKQLNFGPRIGIPRSDMKRRLWGLISEARHLETVSIESCCLISADVQRLCESIHAPLERLILSDCILKSAAIGALSRCFDATCVPARLVALRRCFLVDSMLEPLLKEEWKAVEALDFTGNGLKQLPEGFHWIRE